MHSNIGVAFNKLKLKNSSHSRESVAYSEKVGHILIIGAAIEEQEVSETSIKPDTSVAKAQEVTESHVVPVANAGPAVMLLCAQV